jgi:Flp pilus assembly protein TadD
LLSIGYTYQEQSQEAKARKAYEEALPYARRSEEPWLLAYVTNNLGTLRVPEDLSTAEKLFEESLQAREDDSNSLSPIPVLTNMGNLRAAQGRREAV